MPFIMGLIFSLLSSYLYLSYLGSEIHSSLYIVNPNPIEVLQLMIRYEAKEELAILVAIVVVAFIVGIAIGSLFIRRRVTVIQNVRGTGGQSNVIPGVICPNCGIMNDTEANFCPKCGHKFRVQCSNCLEFNDNNSSFCKKCGSNLKP